MTVSTKAAPLPVAVENGGLMSRGSYAQASTIRLMAGVAFAALALMACHGKSQQQPPPLTDAVVVPRTAPPAASSAQPAEPPVAAVTAEETSEQISNRLVAALQKLGELAVTDGFVAQTNVGSCGPVIGQDYSRSCSFSFEGVQDGNAANLKIFVYDKPKSFDDFDAYVKASVDAAPGATKASSQATATLTNVDTGDKKVVRGECRQALGIPNGDALCTFQPYPRVIMVSIVRPLKSSWSPGEPSADDVDRAERLAMVGFGALAQGKFEAP